MVGTAGTSDTAGTAGKSAGTADGTAVGEGRPVRSTHPPSESTAAPSEIDPTILEGGDVDGETDDARTAGRGTGEVAVDADAEGASAAGTSNTSTSGGDHRSGFGSSGTDSPSTRAAPSTVQTGDPAASTAESAQRRATAHTQANDLLARAELRRLTSGGSRLGLQLGTSDLGPIRIEAIDRGDGLQLHLRSDQAATRALLDAHLDELRDQLRADGIDLGSLDVGGGDRESGSDSSPEASNRSPIEHRSIRRSSIAALPTRAPVAPDPVDGIDLRI